MRGVRARTSSHSMQLNEHCVGSVLEFLCTEEVALASRTSRTWRDAARSEHLWRGRLRLDWDAAPEPGQPARQQWLAKQRDFGRYRPLWAPLHRAVGDLVDWLRIHFADAAATLVRSLCACRHSPGRAFANHVSPRSVKARRRASWRMRSEFSAWRCAGLATGTLFPARSSGSSPSPPPPAPSVSRKPGCTHTGPRSCGAPSASTTGS